MQMRWEDQELNRETAETKFPEVFYASLSLPCRAAQSRGTFVPLDQSGLDAMVESGALNPKARGTRIDRLCLYFRLFCRLGPGGDQYPELGVMHFWFGGESLYAIFHISPQNDWLSIMVVPGEAPNSPLQRTPGSASVSSSDVSGPAPLS
jgi:hypothetical protein